MNKVALLIAFSILTMPLLTGQALRNSLIQYQFNALSINPAYAARLPYTGFEASYYGNFSDGGLQLQSRSGMASLQGPTNGGGLGLTFQFYQTGFHSEISLQPAYARRFELQPGGEIAFGLTMGINYFDINGSILSSQQTDFATVAGGFGIFYHNERFFAGISTLNIFEESLGLDQNDNGIRRENPYFLHIGGVGRILDNLEIKPVGLFKIAEVYNLPETTTISQNTVYEADFQLNFIIDQTYVIGVLRGYTDPTDGTNRNRTGISFTYLFGNFRLSYGIQHNRNSDFGIALPYSHLISAGFDFVEMEETDGILRYF